MSPSEPSNGHAQLSEDEQGVLANLPRTRPQRATRRRLASREGSADSARTRARKPSSSAASEPQTTKASATATPSRPRGQGATRKARQGTRGPRKTTASSAGATRNGAAPRKQRRAGSPTRAKSADPAPRQGFESEGERASGPVQPPGGAELVASAAEIVSEITRAGLSAGERLLRDVFAHLPGSS